MNGRVLRLFIGALLLLSVAVELLLPYTPYEGVPWWHSVPGTYALFGFVFALLLVALAKILGAAGIKHHHDE